MKLIRKYTVLAGFLISFHAICLSIEASHLFSMQSPDKRISLSLIQNNQSGLMYRASYTDGTTILEESNIGFVIEEIDYSNGIDSVELIKSSIIEEEKPILVRQDSILSIYSFYQFKVFHPMGNYEVHFRVRDDGFALRYKFPSNNCGQLREELTSWQIPSGSKVWFFERANHWKLKSYAGLWLNTTTDSLGTISEVGPIQGKPLLYELKNGNFLMITEAALYNYSGMRLKANENRKVTVDFTEGNKGFSIRNTSVSPWRVSIYVEDLNALVNSKFVESLNPEPDTLLFKETDWIKPGKSVWSWWSRDASYMSFENEKRYIDNAGELGFEYALLDEGWENWDNKWQRLNEICGYANKRNVGVWVWKHSKELSNPEIMKTFLDSIKLFGAVGIKVDFMNSESREIIDFEISLLKEAAKRKLLVNFHGCHASTGEYVTYPNELTREGIRGMELNIMGKPLPAWHNAALPFTRFVVGHGDYTPVSYHKKGNTTLAHQLATLVAFDSPLQVIAEDPNVILNDKESESAMPLIKKVPTLWDQTLVLPNSEIGRLVVMARRSGNDWFLAILNGEMRSKMVTIDMSFLHQDKTFVVQMWHDQMMASQNDTGLSYSLITIPENKNLEVALASGGGAVLWMKSKKKN